MPRTDERASWRDGATLATAADVIRRCWDDQQGKANELQAMADELMGEAKNP